MNAPFPMVSGRREGIALIVVLGFLAVLLVLGVGFAVHMRTERLVSRVYERQAVAREMAQAALARAIDTVDVSMTSPALRLYPDWIILRSGDPDDDDILDVVAAEAFNFMPWVAPLSIQGTSDGPTGMRGDVILNFSDRSRGPVLRDGEGTAYLVGGIANQWQAGDAYRMVSEEPVWTYVRVADATGAPTLTDEPHIRSFGRYAFSVINATGLLDAHSVGDAPRRAGLHPRELSVADLTEWAGRFEDFLANRDEDVRYETQEDLFYRNYRPSRGRVFNPPVDFFPRNLFHFSYFPRAFDEADDSVTWHDAIAADASHFGGLLIQSTDESFYPSGWWGNGGLLVKLDIGGTEPADWDPESTQGRAARYAFEHAMTNRFEGVTAGLAGQLGAWAFRNLRDYINDEEPPLLEGPNGRRIPMINEVGATNDIAVVFDVNEVYDPITETTTYVAEIVSLTITNTVALETWFPFGVDAGEEYRLEAAVSVENQTPGYQAPFFPGAGPLPSDPFEPLAGEYRIHGEPVSLTANDPSVEWYGMEQSGNQIRGDFSYDVVVSSPRVVRVEDNRTVDEVSGDLRFTVRQAFAWDIPQEAATGRTAGSRATASIEAIDPRWNWDAGNERLWVAQDGADGTATLGTLNNATRDYRSAHGAPGPTEYILGGTINDLSFPPVDTYDGAPVFTVANAPLESINDLRHINYYPWRSFNLYEFWPVVDHLAVRPRGEHVTERGFVNPNSLNQEVLASLFHGLEGVGDWDDALDLADMILNARRPDPPEEPVEIRRPGDLLREVWDAPNDRPRLLNERIAGVAHRWQLGRRIGHTVELMNPRGNVFVVVMAGQAIRIEPVDPPDIDPDTDLEILGDQRAVAVVWRDPFPDVDGRHRAFVRFLRWLTE